MVARESDAFLLTSYRSGRRATTRASRRNDFTLTRRSRRITQSQNHVVRSVASQIDTKLAADVFVLRETWIFPSKLRRKLEKKHY